MLGLTCFTALTLCSARSTPTREPRSHVENNTFISPHNPEIRVKVDNGFEYIGEVPFTIDNSVSGILYVLQVAPLRHGAGDPENPIENKAMVLRPSPAMGAPNRHEWLKAGPFRIRHQSPNQVRLLAKATLNQNLDPMGILFVNAS